MKSYIIQDPHYTHDRHGDAVFDLVFIRKNGQKNSCSFTEDELKIIYKTIANFLGLNPKVENKNER